MLRLKDKVEATVTNADHATSATTASKLSTNAGSATQPVYFTNGVPVATSYTLGASVPSGAKFTDTNTWRGIQNNLTSDSTSDSLSAAQGKALKTLVDGKAASNHTHNYAGSSSSGGAAYSAGKITDNGNQTALTGTTAAASGIQLVKAYNNGYPSSYGNVISIGGSGCGQILAAWPGTSGAIERLYYRSKRDTTDANWSEWRTVSYTTDKPSTAGTADKLGTNAGSAARPVYFSGGIPVAGTFTFSVSTTDLTAGSSSLATNEIRFVYE